MDISLFRWLKGKSERRYSYTLSDIARSRGVKVEAIRKAIQRGKLKPDSLDSVIEYCGTRQNTSKGRLC